MFTRAKLSRGQRIATFDTPDGDDGFRASDAEHGGHQIERDSLGWRQRIRRQWSPRTVIFSDTCLGTHVHLEAAQEIKVLGLDADDGDFRPKRSPSCGRIEPKAT
jgi:hypothetical protein